MRKGPSREDLKYISTKIDEGPSWERIVAAVQSLTPNAQDLTTRHLERYFKEKSAQKQQPRVKAVNSKKKGAAGALCWEDPETLMEVAGLVQEHGEFIRSKLNNPEPLRPIEEQLQLAIAEKEEAEERVVVVLNDIEEARAAKKSAQAAHRMAAERVRNNIKSLRDARKDERRKTKETQAKEKAAAKAAAKKRIADAKARLETVAKARAEA